MFAYCAVCPALLLFLKNRSKVVGARDQRNTRRMIMKRGYG